jgi:hypothetical protein
MRAAWGREALYAADRLRDDDPGAPTQRWWEPHLVYVLHLEHEGLYKAGITRHDSRRLRDLTAKGRAALVDSLHVANRWTARIIEIDVLQSVVDHHAVPVELAGKHGRFECWRDSSPPPDLAAVSRRLDSTLQLPKWSVSLPPDHPMNRVAGRENARHAGAVSPGSH